MPAVATAWALLALTALSVSAVAAAPSEGTGGQTVTNRTVHRADGSLRANHHAPARSVVVTAKPTWKDLSPTQQQALQPLASQWDSLSAERKAKWLVISKNFSTLSTAEQEKLHQRMGQWATLSRQERVQARQNFQQIKNLTPEQKAAQWEAYQALSPDEKRKLAAQSPAKPAGLATAKPANIPRLSQVPRRAAPEGARIAEAAPPMHQHTLLPRTEPMRSESERPSSEDGPAQSQ